MDLFRKNKKKQSDDLTQQTMQSMTDALDRMVLTSSAATPSDEQAAANSSGIHHVIMNGADSAGSIISGGGKTTTTSLGSKYKNGSTSMSAAGIDTLIDSDEDLAEIFNDGDSDDDDGGNVSMVSEGSHVVGGDGSKVSLSPRQTVDNKNVLNAFGGKNPSSAADSDVDASRARLHHQKKENHSRKSRRNADNASSSEDEDDDEDDDDNNITSEEDAEDDDDERDAEDDKSNSDSAEDYTDDEDEGEDGYKPGGYHSVKIGEVFNQRYVLS
jgi:hypothetical protein